MRDSVLIDTGAFIALLSASDALHRDAVSAYHNLSKWNRVTSNAVVAECYTFFRYQLGADAALHWLDYLDKARAGGHLRIIHADARDALFAEDLLRRFDDQVLSYTDALTLALVERHGVPRIFGFDHHLALTGVDLVPENAGDFSGSCRRRAAAPRC